jgi:16S rRNA (adenine1518-N6/adenine1519-N6)-dimethyltransferase
MSYELKAQGSRLNCNNSRELSYLKLTMATSSNQTISFLRRRFREAGIRPATRHGQNFLIDINLQQLLVRSAQLSKKDVVLEVGTGTGALTAQMAERAGAVVTVEIDAALHQLASEELAEFGNVTMLRQDALKNKNNYHPDVLAAVRERLAEDPSRRFKLVANLPYNIATPIVSNLLSTDIVPVLMIVTIQKELADRISAGPGTKDYGALSIWIQSQCHTETIRVMPPEVFWPRPKVTSAIIQVAPDEALRAGIPDREFFHAFVRAMFTHRRKYLRSGILAAFKKQLGKPLVDEIMAERGLELDSRAEQLDVPAMLALCEAVRARVKEHG